jgi:probable F420-dependent oxidoreductase
MATGPIRLGITFSGKGSVADLLVQARRAEQIGFGTVLLIDHLGNAAPLPPLVAIAAAAPSVRVGNHVINASFHRPALLTRDLASVDSATGGRLDIGLGAGYVKEEFVAAGLPFPSFGTRVQLLMDHVTEIRTRLSDPAYAPPSIQKPPPIMIGGMADKVLAIAAEHADIVSVAPLSSEDRLVERVDYVKAKAGSRIDRIELCFGFFQVSMDNPGDLSVLRRMVPDAPEEGLRQMVTLLDGSVTAAAERIFRYHEELGIDYFTFHKTAATTWRTMEKLVDAITR